MDDLSKDYPIEAHPDSTPFGAEIIDLAGVRIRFGISTAPLEARCEHKSLTYSTADRRVWCEDCNRTIDSFDAFMVLVRGFQDMERAARTRMAKATEALKATTRLRATKVLDHAWSGKAKAICCPHCAGGLLPEDFADGTNGWMSREYEVARRRRALENKKRAGNE